jgi:hypothetical protein
VTIFELAGIVSAIINLLVGIWILFFWHRANISGVKYLRYYFLLAAVTDSVMFVYSSHGVNNMLVANLFCVIRFPLIALTFLPWMLSETYRRAGTLVIVLVSLLFVMVVLTGDLNKMNTVVFSVQNLLFAFMAAIALFRITNDFTLYLTDNHRFWFSVGIFLYFSVSTIIFTTANVILDNQQALMDYTWIINTAMAILANLLYVKGILCLPVMKK